MSSTLNYVASTLIVKQVRKDVCLCICGEEVEEGNIFEHLDTPKHIEWEIRNASTLSECLICYEDKSKFFLCETCLQKHCSTCHSHLKSCPFCRAYFKRTPSELTKLLDFLFSFCCCCAPPRVN